MVVTSPCRRWVFTLNNYTNEHIAAVHAFFVSDCRYGVFGREIAPTTGTPHLQGFLILHNAQRLSYLRNKFPTAHWERARGTSQQAADYCKEDGDYEEHGTLPTEQGRRTDLEELNAWGDEFIAENGRAPTSAEVARHQPLAYLRYPRIVRLFELRAPAPVIREGEPQPWQAQLEVDLAQPANNREVMFFVDPEGGKGKTWFIQYYLSKYPTVTQLLGVAKKHDLAYMIDETKSVFLFNIARGEMDFLQYSVLEHLKDQMVVSTKYQGRTKFLRTVPHVVVFCNEEPDQTKLTHDRFVITRL